MVNVTVAAGDRPDFEEEAAALVRRAVEHASRLVFVADSAFSLYLKRYPTLGPERGLVIPNGYDEKDFLDLTPSVPSNSSSPTRARMPPITAGSITTVISTRGTPAAASLVP